MKERHRCVWCLKNYYTEVKVVKKGNLAGIKIVDLFCSPECSKLNEKFLMAGIFFNDLGELRIKMRKGRKAFWDKW